MKAARPSLIWTRSRDDWESDLALFEHRAWPSGLELVHWPCLRSVPLAVAADDATAELSKAAALGQLVAVVTSAKGAAFAAADPILGPLLAHARRAHTHGEATARILAAQGVGVQLHAPCRTAEQLTEHLTSHEPPETHFLVVSAKKPAFDCAKALAAKGRKATALVCYETLAELTHDEDRVSDLRWAAAKARETHGVVCFASPSAVEAFTAAFAAQRDTVIERVEAMCIGPTTAQAAQTFFNTVHTAPRNALDALLEAALGLFQRP